jgi:recombinational DNA repair protein RecR
MGESVSSGYIKVMMITLTGWFVEMVKCKYCVHMYVNVKLIEVETLPGRGWRIKESGGGGGNSNMIYLILHKSLCKCQNVSPPSTTIKKLKKKFKQENKEPVLLTLMWNGMYLFF